MIDYFSALQSAFSRLAGQLRGEMQDGMRDRTGDDAEAAAILRRLDEAHIARGSAASEQDGLPPAAARNVYLPPSAGGSAYIRTQPLTQTAGEPDSGSAASSGAAAAAMPDLAEISRCFERDARRYENWR